MMHAAGSQAILQVDGGVNANTLVEISAAGATSVRDGQCGVQTPRRHLRWYLFIARDMPEWAWITKRGAIL